jgi:type II secretory pathway predicted ATPase ExeA
MIMKFCRHTFGLSEDPFGADLPRKDIMVTPVITATKERIDYAVRMGGIALMTGDIGSGKSTTLRYLIGSLHPSDYQVISVTACSGSILELYRQLLGELGSDKAGPSRALMARRIKQQILDLVSGKRMKTLLVIDEASLLRLDVFAELHTLTQFEQDSKPYLPMILAGQANLVDNLSYRASKPLASRVVARCHLIGIDRTGMESYLRHHLQIAGCQRMLFEDAAVTAIHQGSGGLYRKANFLARGAMIAASRQEATMVTSDHVQTASSEIF